MNQRNSDDKTIQGYKVLTVVLVLVLAILTVIHFRIINEKTSENEDLTTQRNTLYTNLRDVKDGYDQLQSDNQAISDELSQKSRSVDSLLLRLGQERKLSASKINEYKRELSTLRTIMVTYVRQIDSLNTINRTLVKENSQFRANEARLTVRAESAEERAVELNAVVQRGQALSARNIRITPIDRRERAVSRVSRAVGLRADFMIAANGVAEAGTRTIYARIIGPEGYLLTESANNIFDTLDEEIAFSSSRDVDYQNVELDVSIFYTSEEGLLRGAYTISLYADKMLIGTAEVALK